MTQNKITTRLISALLALCLAGPAWLQAQTNIAAGGTYSENFNSLGVSTTASLPSNWRAAKSSSARTIVNFSSAASAVEQAAGNSMSGSATNGIYRFNANGSTSESAIGGISSASASKTVTVYKHFKNNGSSAISSFEISYDVEKYRNGSNSAGFTIELFYSTDGNSWTSCGSDFTTSFAADGDNNGFNPAPGQTVSITNKTFTPSSSLALNDQFYFAWRYSVTTGTTTSNAQALGIDNVSIKPKAAASISITNGSIAASDVNAGDNNVVLQRYDFDVTGSSTNFNGLTITTAGTYGASDLSNIKLWYSADNTWDSGDELLATISSPAAASNQTFPSFSKSLTVNTHYIFITADIAGSATNNNTINIAATDFANISFSTGTKTGTDPVAAAGTKTIKNSLLSQTITFNSLSAVTYGDAPFNLTATASSSLTVTFASSNTAVATISGNQVTILKAGTVTITASQAGDLTYAPAVDVEQTLTINPKNLSVTGLIIDNKTYDGNNTATISNTGTLVGVVAGDVVSIASATFAQVDAANDIDINFVLTGADAANYSLTGHGVKANILKASQSVNVAPSVIVRNLTSVAVPLPLTSSIGTPISYSVANTAIATYNSVDGTLTPASVGSTLVSVEQQGNTNYEALTYDILFKVINDVFVEDFDDLELSLNPSWVGTNVFGIETASTLPGGSATTDGKYLGSSSSALGSNIIVIPSIQTSEWKFSLGSGDFDPSSTNNFGVILIGNGSIATNSWTGYFLRVGANGSADKLELWRQDLGIPTKVGDFPSSPVFAIGALKNGLDLRVTRSSTGVFEVFYNTGFQYSSTPTTSMGTLTDNTYTTSTAFGIFTFFANPSAQRRAYIDNINLGGPVANNPTSSSVTAHTAILGGNVVSGISIKEVGIVWSSTQTEPTLADNKVVSGSSSTGTFNTFVINLPEASTIYYRAYVIDAFGVGYSAVSNFSTLAGNGKFFAFNQMPTQVIGQSGFGSTVSGLSASNLFGPSGVAIDAKNAKVYVADSKNNRVLRYPYPVSDFSQAAELVFGQNDMVSDSARTSVNGFSNPYAVFVDNTGRLWVSDQGNNRVVWFDNAHAIASNRPSANGVLGQTLFTTSVSGANAVRMAAPSGIFVDEEGTLWVADRKNHRVIRFDNAAKKANGAPADAVLGQSTFTSRIPATTQNGFNEPLSLCIYKGNLYVADRVNHRVVGFKNARAKANGANADLVLGQPNFTTATKPTSPSATVMESPMGCFVDARGVLWVSGRGSIKRIVGFADILTKSNGSAANYVLGPGDFISTRGGTNPRATNNTNEITVHPSDLVLFSTTNIGNFVKVFPLYTSSSARQEAEEDFTSSPIARELVAYPNPTQGLIKFNFGFEDDETFTLAIFDMTGKEVFQSQNSNYLSQGIELSVKGIYVVKFITSQGYNSTLRIVVE